MSFKNKDPGKHFYSLPNPNEQPQFSHVFIILHRNTGMFNYESINFVSVYI